MKLASFRTVRDGAVGVMPGNGILDLAAAGRELRWLPKSGDAVEIEIGRAGVSHQLVH